MQSEALLPFESALPEGIEFATVDPKSGFSIEPSCDNARRMPFRSNAIPSFVSNCGGAGTVPSTVTPVKKAPNWLERIFGN